jgi:predicted DNA-binding protein YlxM (UPF0122 family)
MEKTKEQIKAELEFFLHHSDLSTFEIAEKFNISEAEIVERLLEDTEY